MGSLLQGGGGQAPPPQYPFPVAGGAGALVVGHLPWLRPSPAGAAGGWGKGEWQRGQRAQGTVPPSWQHPPEHPPWLGGCAAPCTQDRLSRGSPHLRRVPKPLRTLGCRGGPQRGGRGLVLGCREMEGGLRWLCIAPGPAGPRYRDGVTARGRGRGQQCPGGGSRDPAASCLHLAAALCRVSPSGAAGAKQGLRGGRGV